MNGYCVFVGLYDRDADTARMHTYLVHTAGTFLIVCMTFSMGCSISWTNCSTSSSPVVTEARKISFSFFGPLLTNTLTDSLNTQRVLNLKTRLKPLGRSHFLEIVLLSVLKLNGSSISTTSSFFKQSEGCICKTGWDFKTA